MVIGILSVRDERYHPNRRLLEAASKCGHSVILIHTRDCLAEIEDGQFGFSLHGQARPDVLIPRIGATINDYALAVVRHFEMSGVRVINGFEAILQARNKFLSLQTLAAADLPVPDTRLVVNPKGLSDAVESLGGYPVVVKMPSGRQGNGVGRIDGPLMSDFVMENLQDNSRGLLIQEYLEPKGRKDIRAFVLGHDVIGAMELTPPSGDFRSNIHLTEAGKRMVLDRDLSQLAVRSAGALGLEIAGADIIVDEKGDPKIIEVNYTPGFNGLEAATGCDIAGRIIGYAANPFTEKPCTSPS